MQTGGFKKIFPHLRIEFLVITKYMKQCSFLFMNGVFRDAFKIKINILICIVVKVSLYIDWFSNSLVFTYTPLVRGVGGLMRLV